MTWPDETIFHHRWGYVIFSKMHEAEKVIMDRLHYIDGKKVYANRYGKNNEPASKKLLIENVRNVHTENDFKNYFCTFGEVAYVNMIPHRRIAVVTFKSPDPVDKCALLQKHKIAGYTCDVTRIIPSER